MLADSPADPPPPVPPEVDLRHFPFMPLDIVRLLTSETWIEGAEDPKPAHAALSLWAASWHQVPAGSLPDNDRVLARLALCDAATWARIRGQALRGFVLCSDGRLYHRVVAEKAREAWDRHLAQRRRTEAASRARRRLRQDGDLFAGAAEHRDEACAGDRDERQREDKREQERDSAAAGEASPAAPPAAADPLSVIAECDAVIAAVFGAAQRRPWPAALDPTTVKDWLAAGATPALVRDVVAAQCRKLLAKGKRPPASLRFFDRDVRDAVAGLARVAHAVDLDAAESQERARLRGFVERQSWLPIWGPPPGRPGCTLSPRLLAEFGIGAAP